MTNDITETVRREMVQSINVAPTEREQMESKHGRVWNTDELSNDFEVTSFMAPFVVVRRKVDKVKGSLLFQHSPRFYYGFVSN